MFRLRQDHVDAFEGAALDDFLSLGVAHLRSHLAAETKPFTDDELKLRIRQCIKRAYPYGLATEPQVMTFVDATYLAGEQFDQDPRCSAARQLLDDPTASPETKATLLLLMLPVGVGDVSDG